MQEKLSHKEAIKRLLTINRNEWVDLPYLSNYTAHKCYTQCYVIHSRIAELRKEGMSIENRIERGAHNEALSKYKFVSA